MRSLFTSSGLHGGLLATALVLGATQAPTPLLAVEQGDEFTPLVSTRPLDYFEEVDETLETTEALPELDEPTLVERFVADVPPPTERADPRLAEAVTPPSWDDLDWSATRVTPQVEEPAEPLHEPAPELLASAVASAPCVQEPLMLDAPAPRYPPLSVRLGEQGRVECRLFIDAAGRVVRVLVVTSSGHERLDRAAVEALESWRFRPRTEDGVAVPSDLLHPVTFVLEDR